MADNWYYGRKGQQFGPFSESQLNQLATSGQLLPTDLVWKKGMAQWVKAGTIKGLLSPSPTPLPHTPRPLMPIGTPPSLTNMEEDTGLDIGNWTAASLASSVKTSGLLRGPSKKGKPLWWINVGVPLALIGVSVVGLTVIGLPLGLTGSIPITHLTVEAFARQAANDPEAAMKTYKGKEIAVTGHLSHGGGKEYVFRGGAACVICTLAKETEDSVTFEDDATFVGRFEKYERHPSGYWLVYLSQARYVPPGQDNGANQQNAGSGPRMYSRAEFLDKLKSLGGKLGWTDCRDPSACPYPYTQVSYCGTLDVWVQNFGEPKQLPDSANRFQRWRYMCSDGPITFYGNIIKFSKTETRLSARMVCYY